MERVVDGRKRNVFALGQGFGVKDFGGDMAIMSGKQQFGEELALACWAQAGRAQQRRHARPRLRGGSRHRVLGSVVCHSNTRSNGSKRRFASNE